MAEMAGSEEKELYLFIPPLRLTWVETQQPLLVAMVATVAKVGLVMVETAGSAGVEVVEEMVYLLSIKVAFYRWKASFSPVGTEEMAVMRELPRWVGQTPDMEGMEERGPFRLMGKPDLPMMFRSPVSVEMEESVGKVLKAGKVDKAEMAEMAPYLEMSTPR